MDWRYLLMIRKQAAETQFLRAITTVPNLQGFVERSAKGPFALSKKCSNGIGKLLVNIRSSFRKFETVF